MGQKSLLSNKRDKKFKKRNKKEQKGTFRCVIIVLSKFTLKDETPHSHYLYIAFMPILP